MTSGPPKVAVIRAGGRGRRLGTVNKSFAELGGRPLIAHVIGRIAPQVSTVLVNTTGDVDRFLAFGLTVVADQQPEISLHGMMERMRGARVIFGDGSPIDPFFNVNTADDLDTAERLMSRFC